MSSTNKTTNYNLSQFLGTDKPSWLGDYNGDMSAIDAQMKLNADAASTAAGGVSTNTAAIGTLSNLTTDAKTNLVAAVNEVDAHADTAQSTANSASSTANSANTTATGVAAFLNINSFTDYDTSNMAIMTGGGTLRSNTHITVARNTDGSLAKIYGVIVVDNPTSTTGKVKLNVDTGLRPSEKITITGTGFTENVPQSYGLTGLNIDINTDGTIEFYGAVGDGTVYIMRAIACLIFVSNFGDQPE